MQADTAGRSVEAPGQPRAAGLIEDRYFDILAVNRMATALSRAPQVGEMTLNRERLTSNGTGNLMLVVYHPDAGSGDADKLALLASAVLPTTGAKEDEAAARRGQPSAPGRRF